MTDQIQKAINTLTVAKQSLEKLEPCGQRDRTLYLIDRAIYILTERKE